MGTSAIDLDLRHVPVLPERRDYPIGIIGAGFIVADIQIPAYQAAGYTVAAIASRTPAQRARGGRAARHPEGPRHLAASSSTTRASRCWTSRSRPTSSSRSCSEAVKRPHIKGILAQKPLAADYDEAVRDRRGRARRRQGARRQPEHALRPVDARAEDAARPRRPRRAGARHDRHARHPALDAVPRGHRPADAAEHVDPPPRLVPLPVRRPRGHLRQRPPRPAHEVRSTTTASASTSSSTTTASAPPPGTTSGAGPVREGSEGDIYIRWRVEGTEGLARGTIGWPTTRRRTPSTFDFTTIEAPRAAGSSPRWNEVWFPDAFAGHDGRAVRALERAARTRISGRRQPAHDGAGRGGLPLARREARRAHRRDPPNA